MIDGYSIAQIIHLLCAIAFLGFVFAVATLKTTKKTKIPEDIKTNYLKRNATSLTIDI